MTPHRRGIRAGVVPGFSLGLLLLVCLQVSIAQDKAPLTQGLDPKIQLELQYAEALQRLGMPDYAELVISRINDPAAKTWAEVLKLQGMLSMGKFDDVKKLIGNRPDADSQPTWAMKMALADAYYAWGKYGEAQGIYESLFKKYPSGPPEGLRSFFIESCYKYAQMLLLMNKTEGAVEAYRNLIKANPEKYVARQVKTEMAELLIKVAEAAPADKRQPYFDEIKKICDEILWIQDVWFGKAVVYLAHMKMLQGDVEGAQKIVENYRDKLVAIDESLKEESEKSGEDLTKLSPMAQCRYLLAVIMHSQADKLLAEDAKKNKDKVIELLVGKKDKATNKSTTGAYQHFINVFIKYPNTQWAPDCGKRTKQIEEVLATEYGVKLKPQISEEDMEKAKKNQFMEAHNLYNLGQYQQSADAYLTVLSMYPEGEMGLAALEELAHCYVEIPDELYAEVVARYIAERFCKKPETVSAAGDAVLRIAELLGERKMPDKKDQLYKLFFDLFTTHPRMAGTLFRFGEDAYKAEDYDASLSYFQQIVDKYKESPLYLDAMNRVAMCYNKKSDTLKEIKVLEEYAPLLEKKDRPGHALPNAKFRLALAYKSLDSKYLPSAFNRFSDLIKLLSNKDNPYQNTPEEAKANEDMLEASMYFQGMCYCLLKDKDEAKMQGYKQSAVKVFEDLVARFPKSRYAASALSQIGTLYTMFEKPKEAEAAFLKLKSQHPDSAEAQNVSFVLAMNLLSLGKRQEAIPRFKEMFSGGGNYKPSQILTAGNELLKAKEYEIAGEAFDRALAMGGEDRAILEPAMIGKGKVEVYLKKYAEATKTLEEALKKYPNSGFTVESCYLLGSSYSELAVTETDKDKRFDLFNLAVKALNKVRKYDQTEAGAAKSGVEVARISERKAKAEEQFGGDAESIRKYRGDAIAAYQTLLMMSDLNNQEVRPFLEQAFFECLPLMMQLELYQDVFDDCGKYLETFPRGKYVNDIRGWRSSAKVKLASSGGVATASTNAVDTVEEEDLGDPTDADTDTEPAATNAPAAGTNAPAAEAAAPATPPAEVKKPAAPAVKKPAAAATTKPAAAPKPATAPATKPAVKSESPAAPAPAAKPAVKPAASTPAPVDTEKKADGT